MEIVDNEFLRQFEVIIEGELATIEYSLQEKKIFLTRLIMDPELKEKGYTETFIEAVLEKIKENERIRVMPTSPVIVSFMRKNRRKYKDLLPVGINI